MTSSTSDQGASDFRPLPLRPGYIINSAGIVISHKTSNPKILKYGFDGGGRITVAIHGRPVPVANLVREVFGLNLCPYTLKPVTVAPPLPSDLIADARARLLKKWQEPPLQPIQAPGVSGGASAT